MSTVKGTISAGACGFVTEVTAVCEDGQQVSFEISTPCEKIRALAGALPVVDAFAEMRTGVDGAIISAARNVIPGCCAGCVIPAGLSKAMQVAAGLALPQTVTMSFDKQ